MIEWIPFNKENPPEPGRYFVSDGIDVDVADYSSIWDAWVIRDDSSIDNSNAVTRYGIINPPWEDTKCVEITITEYVGDKTFSKSFKIGSGTLHGMPKRATARANKFVTECLQETLEHWESLPGEEEA
ncbi:hypothetical protein [Paenibacillus sp. FSL R5-0486]|uniref:hypothetical protein n=1 Tax=Paenibacillus sp. FSL R5-0486 TaxID=2921645 RepID=UPI0030D7520B